MNDAMIHDVQVESREKDCVSITPEAIQEEFVRLPADLAYWNARYARALKAYLTAKKGEKEMEALLTIQHRERFVSEGGKPTEKTIEAAVTQDPKMQEARELLIDTEVDKVKLWGTLDAVRAKKEMLISLGAHLRQEMDGDPSIRRDRADSARVRRENS